MSRPKSPARLALERDRAIREERRHQKVAEREAKRQIRLKKHLTHESVVKNGVPKVRSGGTELGILEIVTYLPYALCEACQNAIRESSMIGKLCERCHYLKEANDPKEDELKAHGDRAPHSCGERETKPDALAGQLKLI